MTLPPATTLTIGAQGHSTTFTRADDVLTILRNGERTCGSTWHHIETPVRNVLWAELSGDSLQVSFLGRRKKKSALSLVNVTGKVNSEEIELASAFTTALMDAAYVGLKRHRRLRVLINPKSGPGNGRAIYLRKVEPILRAARCVVDATFTTHPRHALELSRELELDQFDAVVAMSGDGLVHEVINGFAEHATPEEAFRMPIAPVPSGSGNGMALNLLGIQDGYDVSAATLNAIKGRPMRIDLCSVTQDGKKHLSFMSQTVGLFANLDMGTECLRFMGSSRFVVGYVYEVLKLKPCPIKLSMKLPQSDKKQMVHNLHSYQSKAKARSASQSGKSAPTPDSTTPDADTTSLAAPSTVVSSALPDSKSAPPSPHEDEWITLDMPLTYAYAGKGPYVSRDLMQFPVSIPDDGLVDIVAQELTTRKAMIDAMDGSEEGKQFWMESQHYFRARAYRVETLSPKGCLSVDGEEYPFETFEVECHRAMATVLSPCGYYPSAFPLPDDSG